MTPFNILKAVALGLCLSIPTARADAPPFLVGTWSVVRVDNVLPDGTHVALYGPHPEGLLIFDAGGRYSLQLLRAARTRFAANDKSQGTPAELKAAVEGSNAHFGHYTIDPAHTIRFEIDHASFPNWDGTVQLRNFTLVGDRLTYVVPSPTTDRAATGEVEWQRLP
ncbi:MAG TPA: lipocalin-like domain-containing protein [Aliidongia sp.]|uniref:lipocalin-like domain-containing protein n=1 Tax=Aliidongia sp. TaxID=1914230 RepID=UPI002DDDACEF|nr:lipocalin-like domain-containing protein [Aliidongia sp.]HEV2677742.1 lipocalin-like domain-containing protein [Aliidongia sp.]